jgi:3-deoxy-D-manno-octulosonate 8-phosphate phosphatase (KDO 8-P phosphatase)
MYYDEQGNEFKKFNTSDSAGVLFCRLLNIEVGIITGENSNAVKRRAKKLKIQHCFVDVKDKVHIAQKLMKQHAISWDEIAYIGDDINDIELLNKVGLSACPINASQYIKDIVDWVIPTKGGDGAFRHFVEKYIETQNKMDFVLETYLKIKKE